MDNFKQIIKNIFEDHGFEEDFYSGWYNLFGHVKSYELDAFLHVLKRSSKEELEKFTDNMNKKITALHDNDIDSWGEIVKKEKNNV